MRGSGGVCSKRESKHRSRQAASPGERRSVGTLPGLSVYLGKVKIWIFMWNLTGSGFRYFKNVTDLKDFKLLCGPRHGGGHQL